MTLLCVKPKDHRIGYLQQLTGWKDAYSELHKLLQAPYGSQGNYVASNDL